MILIVVFKNMNTVKMVVVGFHPHRQATPLVDYPMEHTQFMLERLINQEE